MIAARLLDAQAQIYETQTRSVAAHASLHKALVLLLAALRRDESLRTPLHRDLIGSILSRLTGYVLPEALQAQADEWKRT